MLYVSRVITKRVIMRR